MYVPLFHSIPSSFVFVCLAYWIDVKFDWITKFEIDAGFDNCLASLTSEHVSPHSRARKSFVVHFANVFRNRQCIKCQIQLLMHPRQNYKQKQFKHVENEASNEKFIGWAIKCHFTSWKQQQQRQWQKRKHRQNDTEHFEIRQWLYYLYMYGSWAQWNCNEFRLIRANNSNETKWNETNGKQEWEVIHSRNFTCCIE